MAGEAPVTINPVLSAIAVAYRNTALIADLVLPRTPAVGTKEFRFTKFTTGDAFTIPDTKVGRRGRPNVVEAGGAETTAKCYDYGLEDEIPQDDIDQTDAAGNPMLASLEARSTEWLTNLIALDREVRVAGAVFNAAIYPAANKAALSGTGQWSDYVNSTPLPVITAALDVPVLRPNVCALGQSVWTKVRSHPQLVQAVNGTTGAQGAITRQQFCDIFELEELIVGQAWFNTAKKGQATALSRAWGKGALFFNRDKLADRERGMTFGYTVPWGGKVAASWPDRNIGLRGGQRVRSGETVCELIAAPDCAYYFDTAIA